MPATLSVLKKVLMHHTCAHYATFCLVKGTIDPICMQLICWMVMMELNRAAQRRREPGFREHLLGHIRTFTIRSSLNLFK